MRVMKFGGASLQNAEAVRKVVSILKKYKVRPLVIVVSAFAKTTNHLVALAESASRYDRHASRKKFLSIREFHFDIVNRLFGKSGGSEHKSVMLTIGKFFEDIDDILKGIHLLREFPSPTYDRIVSYGELLSSAILSHFFKRCGLKPVLIDARRCIKTDSNFKNANVLWEATEQAVRKEIFPVIKRNLLLIPGYISSSSDGKTTTLGREGSDYTAAILANILNAEEVIVWKDVDGIYNMDPHLSKNKRLAKKLDSINYTDAVEMFYYGAKIIHPKTIRPLENKKIPLLIKSFAHPERKGTIIGEGSRQALRVPCMTEKENQCLLTFVPKDFAFITGEHLTHILEHLHHYNVRVNLVQNSAISLSLCVDNETDSVSDFVNCLENEFECKKDENVRLRTITNCGKKHILNHPEALLVQKDSRNLHIVIP